jgi:vitamin B12 transporter
MSAVIGDEFDPFDQFNFGASIKFENKKTFYIKTGFDFSNIQSDYDNNFPLEDAPFKLSTQMNRFHLNSNYNYKNGGLSLRMGHQKTKRDFQSSFPFQTDAESTQLEIFNKYVFREEFYSVIGVLIQQNFADYEGGQKITQNDFFGNFVAKFSDDFRINLGGRWNNNYNYGSQFTYSINPSWRLINGNDYSLKIHSALSTAFISPSLYQLFDPYSGNIDLKPEENSSFEAGLIFNNKKWSFSSNYFSRLETPSLVYDLVTYRYENTFKEARYYGVETVFSGVINSKIFIDQQITFTETKDGDLRYLPNFSSQTNLSYSFLKSWNVNLTMQLFGKRFGLDNITVLDAYQLLNLNISHQLLNIPLKLFVHATNVLNTDYIEIEGYATKGRNLVVGISYDLP